MISITFSCETQSQLHDEIVKFVNSLSQNLALNVSVSPEQEAFNFEEKPQEEKPKKTKKKAEEKAPEIKTPGSSLKPVSKDEVYAALQGITTALGLPVARNILKEFGAEKISDLSFENYRPFIDKCIEMTPV